MPYQRRKKSPLRFNSSPEDRDVPRITMRKTAVWIDYDSHSRTTPPSNGETLHAKIKHHCLVFMAYWYDNYATTYATCMRSTGHTSTVLNPASSPAQSRISLPSSCARRRYLRIHATARTATKVLGTHPTVRILNQVPEKSRPC